MGTFLKANDDAVLNFINGNLVALRGNDKKMYMEHYLKVLECLLDHMKREDKLFNAIYQRTFWAGSYYDGLKIGKPDEYDVDLVMKLPIDYEEIEIDNGGVTPPFIKINANGLKQLRNHPRYEEYKPMEFWIDENGFLLQSKFRAWMDSVSDKAQNVMPRAMPTSFYTISHNKTGPAVTYHISVATNPRIELDIDLVPVIEFKAPKWPPTPTKKNPVPDLESWFIVPKPNSKEPAKFRDTFWRFAFHDQEKEIIDNKQLLKPVCRLIKQLRDTQGFQIPSYYIKTMFMWEIQERKDSYWTESTLGPVFMDMLRKLRDHIKLGRIKNFWDSRANLLITMGEGELENLGGRLDNIIRDIECRVDEYPNIFAKYLLTPEQLERFLDFCKPGH